jgi:hypothetical protein
VPEVVPEAAPEGKYVRVSLILANMVIGGLSFYSF